MSKYKLDDVSFSISRFCPGKCLNCNIYKEEHNLKDEIDSPIYENILKSNNLQKCTVS